MKIFGQNVQSSLPIFVADLTGKPELDLARIAVRELRDTVPGIESNVKSVYTSPYDSHIRNKNLIPLSKLVCKVAAFITENAMGQKLSFEVVNCWTSIYNQGDHAVSHNHWACFFSAVVYLEADGNSAPLIFENQTSIMARKNHMVLFPGWVQHEVPKTEGPRTVIAYNLTAVFDESVRF